jgi:surface antigen
MKLSALAVLLFLPLLVSCANKGQTGTAAKTAAPEKTAVAETAAAVPAGQTIGHKTEVTLASAAVGTLAGTIIGQAMDKYDRKQLNHIYERGTSNQRSCWLNPDTGNQYSVTPDPAYQNPATRRVCRRAQIEANIKVKQEKAVATACRDDDGHWELQQ